VYSTSECQALVGKTSVVAFNYGCVNYSPTFSLAVMLCILVQSCLLRVCECPGPVKKMKDTLEKFLVKIPIKHTMVNSGSIVKKSLNTCMSAGWLAGSLQHMNLSKPSVNRAQRYYL
jgi:hypothetical protein